MYRDTKSATCDANMEKTSDTPRFGGHLSYTMVRQHVQYCAHYSTVVSRVHVSRASKDTASPIKCPRNYALGQRIDRKHTPRFAAHPTPQQEARMHGHRAKRPLYASGQSTVRAKRGTTKVGRQAHTKHRRRKHTPARRSSRASLCCASVPPPAVHPRSKTTDHDAPRCNRTTNRAFQGLKIGSKI